MQSKLRQKRLLFLNGGSIAKQTQTIAKQIQTFANQIQKKKKKKKTFFFIPKKKENVPYLFIMNLFMYIIYFHV